MLKYYTTLLCEIIRDFNRLFQNHRRVIVMSQNHFCSVTSFAVAPEMTTIFVAIITLRDNLQVRLLSR